MILHGNYLPSIPLNNRAIHSPPPPARTSHENNPTLLVSWWCTGFALAIILLRVTGRYIRTERLFREDKIMALSMIPLMVRMGLVHVVLIWGTNNALISGTVSAEEIRKREIGSKLVLPSRIILWIAKFTISEFLKRLTSQVWKRSYELGLQIIRYFLVVTFVAVVIATLAECQPFSHYWQVVPDPGARCRQGIAQLMTMATSDIITDLLLVCFPIPIVLKSNMPIKRKCSLILLFALSLILVAITIYRVIGVIDRDFEQQFRSLLASLEILAAAAVSNALVLGSFVRDRGAKKQRWRYGSQGGHSSQDRGTHTPRRAITQRNWGSDADLVGDLGIRCAPELTEKENHTPRPAPVALPTERHAKNLTPAPRRQHAPEGLNLELKDSKPRDHQPLNATDIPTTPKTPSFFDVGGLLGDNEQPGGAKQHSITVPQPRDFSCPASLLQSAPVHASWTGGSRKGSDAFLEDIGGLLPAGSAVSENCSSPIERGVNLADVPRETGLQVVQLSQQTNERRREPPLEIQDIGGLLSSNPIQARRPSTSNKRGMSLSDELGKAEPDIERDSPSEYTPVKASPPEIQDVGGLLSAGLTQLPGRPSDSDMRDESLVHVLRETGPSISPERRLPPRKLKNEPVGLQDVVLAEGPAHHGKQYIPQTGFQQFIEAWLSFIQRGIALFGGGDEWPYEKYTFREGEFRIDVNKGEAGRPTWDDFHSVGVTVRDNILHFAVSRRKYSNVRVTIDRIGIPGELVEAVVDLWYAGTDVGYLKPTGTAQGQALPGRLRVAQPQQENGTLEFLYSKPKEYLNLSPTHSIEAT
ncbi:MAG: hypothetical protein Q9217_002976 [Psora testacea]